MYKSQGIVRLTDELRKRKYIKKYIAASTPEVYGATKSRIKETHRYHPSTPYAASKISADQLCLSYYRSFLDASSCNENILVDSDWTYNASTNKMTVGNIGFADNYKIVDNYSNR